MKTKVSKLEGLPLAAAVAITRGWKCYPSDSAEKGMWWHTSPDCVRLWAEGYRPDCDWSTCGVLIEQYSVSIEGPTNHPDEPENAVWRATTGVPYEYVGEGEGPTPQIAICRAVVDSKARNGEINIPDHFFTSPKTEQADSPWCY